METYKDIAGYKGLYQVSNRGNVKSLIKRYKGSDILKVGIDRGGYCIVTLCKEKKHITKTVHRLAALAFYGHSEKQVNHLDGNKQNNNIENLKFVTAKENIRHAFANGLLIPNTDKIAKDKRKVVLQIDSESGSVLNKYESAHEAARITGFNRGNISTCCREGKIMYKNRWEYEVK